jgi:hypothetical protein
MTADATDYLVSTTIDAYEADTRIHARPSVQGSARQHDHQAFDNIDVVCGHRADAGYGDLLGLRLRLPYNPARAGSAFAPATSSST